MKVKDIVNIQYALMYIVYVFSWEREHFFLWRKMIFSAVFFYGPLTDKFSIGTRKNSFAILPFIPFVFHEGKNKK